VVIPYEHSKGEALRDFAAKEGIKKERMISVGDGY
jgi:phosphoserine phosphatase